MWKHLIDLYKKCAGANTSTPGLSILPQLTLRVEERPGFTDVEKKQMQPTLDGLRMTGNNIIITINFSIQWTCTAMNCLSHAVNVFVVLVQYLFTIPGVKVFLSEKVSQDPIENSLAASDNEGEGERI